MKKITFEQFKQINNFNYMGNRATFRHRSDFATEDSFYLVEDRLDDHIKTMTWRIDFENAKITDEKNYIEYLNQLLIHELEDDDECRVHSDGKLFTSYYYDESKKETQRLKNNASSKISRCKSKIKDYENNLTKLNELKEFIKTIEVVEE